MKKKKFAPSRWRRGVFKIRYCLKCSKKFKSKCGAFVCDKCRDMNNKLDSQYCER